MTSIYGEQKISVRVQNNNGIFDPMATNKETKITLKVQNNNGILNPVSPLVVKNQFREYQINSIQDLPDVDEIEVTNGATIVYNTSTTKYEVKQIDIDGGEY